MCTKIASIDIETPNRKNDSVCSIGITAVDEYGEISQYYSLVNPEDDFDLSNIRIHGITSLEVADSPIFPEIWNRIKNYFSDYLIIGHNVRFDLCCIKKVLNKYRIDAANPFFADTLELSKQYAENAENHKLDTLCKLYEIPLAHHHNALDDCEAAYSLFYVLINKYSIDINDFTHQYDFSQNESMNHRKTFGYCDTTKNLQELQGLLIGVMSDGELNDKEIVQIKYWVETHLDLSGNYPFDKIYKLLQKVFEDNIITEQERADLCKLFNSIISPIETDSNIVIESDIVGKAICLTGDFECMNRKDFSAFLAEKGAVIKSSVTKKLDYLVVGEFGSDKWSQGNYGTKIKKAMELNEKGCEITIIKEDDFIKIFEI